MLPDKYGIHEKTVKKADGSYRSLPMLRIHYIIFQTDRRFPGTNGDPVGLITRCYINQSNRIWKMGDTI